MIKRIFLTGLAFFAVAFADDIAITLPTSENLSDKIRFLKEIKEQGVLDESLRKDFTDLWNLANNVAKMNDRCGTVSINDALDEDCRHFYEVDLPAFEEKYFEITGEFRLNAVRASNALNDKRVVIGACVDALSPDAYMVSNIMTVMGEVTPEPLENDMAMLRYNLALAVSNGKRAAIEKQLAKWYEACSKAIISQDEFSPLFVQKIKKNTSGRKAYVDIDDEKIMIVQGIQEIFSYYINDRFLFGKSILKGAPILTIYKSGELKFINTAGISWKGYTVFKESEIQKKGFNGRLQWGKRLAPLRTIRLLKSGKVFKSVVIGNQEWTAMDLGKMTWKEALELCPDGWHLPSNEEWIALGNFVQENSYGAPIPIGLKASYGWKQPGIDLYGFSAFPRVKWKDNEYVIYWSSNNVDKFSANIWKLHDSQLQLSEEDKRYTHYVRCVKDSEVIFKD